MRPDLYVGLISGTSVDGIDAALVEFGDRRVKLIHKHSHAYPDSLREAILAAIRSPADCTIDDFGSLDARIGIAFGEAALALLDGADRNPAGITAIGSHGQTLRHQPDAEPPFTLQAGDPAIIATATGITTVADFRRQDLALGGQGAPLVPPFHEWLFAEAGRSVVVANLGGIANLTLLPADGSPARGFDTGPANTLLDAWIRRCRNLDYDKDGRWAASGTVDDELLEAMLGDDYLRRAPPKSTGFEYFNLDWLARFAIDDLEPENVQATLLELTARSLTQAIEESLPDREAICLCGGGASNGRLVERIAALAPGVAVESTRSRGLAPDWVEAVAFAWLARERLAGRPGNLPAVTGARRPSPLGGIYEP